MWQPDPRNPYTLIEWDGRCFMVEHRPAAHYIAHQDNGTTTAMSAPQVPAIWECCDGQWMIVGNDMTRRVIMDLHSAHRPAGAATRQPLGDLVPADSPDQPIGQGVSTKTSFISLDDAWESRLAAIFDRLVTEGRMLLEKDYWWVARATKKEVHKALGGGIELSTFEGKEHMYQDRRVYWRKQK